MSEDQENQIIETLDDNGNTVLFSIVDIIDFENKEYALLNNVDKDGNVLENGDIVVMRLDQKGDDYSLELIDDAEFKKVSNYISSLQEEEE
ncbi:DUF1292 domain-containing protein [bacterium]|nr:DUF1292 domain-containing protein [bacterium]